MEREDFGEMSDAEWRSLTQDGPLGSPGRRRVSDETWAMVRRGWEQGETGQSLARRFDVGLANLWRRRQSEDWRRPAPVDRVPEPLEGWEAVVRQRLETFEERRAHERLVAERLVDALTGAMGGQAPLWHLGYLLHRRAAKLGPEAAQADRERLKAADWADCVWDADGALRPLWEIDAALVRAHPGELLGALELPQEAARWVREAVGG